jgi:N6-adenosine-specific RNA methylase IME4
MNASTVFTAPVTRLSAKPDEFYRLVESCSPGPYLDVFARRKRPGWDVFGDQVAPEFSNAKLTAAMKTF